MAAGQTYEPIATTTLASAVTNYTFNSISGAYTDLILIISGKAGANPSYGSTLQFNGDTGTNYDFVYMYGTGSSAASSSKTSQTYATLGYGTGVGSSSPTIYIAHIQNYSNTTTYKSVISRASNYDTTYGGTEMSVSSWRSTSAITSIKVDNPFGSMTFAIGTTMTLFGITAA